MDSALHIHSSMFFFTALFLAHCFSSVLGLKILSRFFGMNEVLALDGLHGYLFGLAINIESSRKF